MKRWQELLGRRDFLRLTGKAGLTVVVGTGAVSALGTAQAAGESTGGTAAAQLKSKAKSGGAGSRGTPTARNFLRASSPIDRTLGDATPREFFGDRNQRPHGALWDLKTYFATHKVEGSDEEAAVVVVGGGVSGLFTSYALRKHKPILLEQAARFGGNAKGQSWRGVDYSIGTAYIDQPHEGAPMHGLFHELGLGEILTALIEAGLRLDFLHEHREVAWQALPWMVTAEGSTAAEGARHQSRIQWRLPDEQRELCPLMYSLKATRPT